MNHCLKGSCHAIRFIKAESLQHEPRIVVLDRRTVRQDRLGQPARRDDRGVAAQLGLLLHAFDDAVDLGGRPVDQPGQGTNLPTRET